MMALSNANVPTPIYKALETKSPFCGVKSACPLSCGTPLPYPNTSSLPSSVIRYHPDDVKKHIETVILENRKESSFQGLDALKEAADQGVLRQGQLIFGTVSIAHHEDIEGTWQGWLYNLLTPFIMKIKTGQMRKFAYLHTAVYSGKYKDRHYVIENGGGDFSEGLNESSRGLGTIDVKLLEKAFEKDAVFFVVSPPKDSRGKSTRYLVQQRALACIGLRYKYSMRAVSCETFATALLGLLDENYFAPLQLEVLRSRKREHPDIEEQKERDKHKFEEFHKTLWKQIEKVPPCTILTLKYYMDGKEKLMFPLGSKEPWFFKMIEAYTDYIEAARSGNTKMCLDLLKMGLNPEGRFPTYTGTAVMEAAREGHWETVAALVGEGADRTEIQTLLNDTLNYAASQGQTQLCLELLKLCINPEGRFMSYRGSIVEAAVRAGHRESAVALVKEGADRYEIQQLVNDAINDAAANGYTQICLDLINLSANPEELYQSYAGSAVEAAVQAGHRETVIGLVKERVNEGDVQQFVNDAVFDAVLKGYTEICLDILQISLSSEGNFLAYTGTLITRAISAGVDATEIQPLVNNGLINAASMGNTQRCLDLIKLSPSQEGIVVSYTGSAVEAAVCAGHMETVESLIKERAYDRGINQLLNDALSDAALKGYMQMSLDLIKFNLNCERNLFGNRSNIVTTAIRVGVDLSKIEKLVKDALIDAASSGQTQMCLDLLKLELNSEGAFKSYTGSVVEAAVLAGHRETVSGLVKEGIHQGVIRPFINDALLDAAAKGHTQICLDLINLCLNPTELFQSYFGSAVEAAVREGKRETVSVLIKEGSSRGGVQQFVYDALIDAAAKGYTQICLDILKLLYPNSEGKFPHSISYSVEAAVRAGHEETVSALIKEGVDGGEAIVVAAEEGNTRMVDLLLTLTPHHQQRDIFVSEALLRAAQHGHTSTAVTLINHNANIEHKNIYGGTALINAAQNGHTDTVKVLLRFKANIEHNNGNTALTIAALKGHTSTVTELLRHKANIEHKTNL